MSYDKIKINTYFFYSRQTAIIQKYRYQLRSNPGNEIYVEKLNISLHNEGNRVPCKSYHEQYVYIVIY